MEITITIVIAYLLIGIVRVGYDFFQPPYNQPRYTYEKRWARIILYIFLWPVLMYTSLDYFYFWQYLKKRFRILLRFKEADIPKPENGSKGEHTGSSRLNAIENELKNKNRKIP